MALAAVFACSKYDSPDDVHITAYGSAVKYNGTGVADYYLLQDDGAILYIKNLLWDYELYKDGQRVKFNYEIMDDSGGSRTAASGETHDITLYYISMVPEYDTVALSFIMGDEEHRQDSIGNDPLGEITKMFFSGGYLNVEYTYWKRGTQSHDIRLVVDDINATENEVTVYIRHNANGDAPKGTESGFSRNESEVSFSIGSLIPAGKNSITVNFIWTEYAKGKNKTWNDVVERTEQRVFSLGSGPNKQIVGSVQNNMPVWY